MGIAKEMIRSAKSAGLEYVKFQTRNPDICVPENEKNKMRDTPWGYITYLEYKKAIEFSHNDYHDIDLCCVNNKIAWFSSPWDATSAEFLVNFRFKLPFIKIPSACITDMDLLDVVKTGTSPVIISTGMSTKKEVDRCVNYLGDHLEYILACTSTYPTKNSDMNLSFIKTLKGEYSRKYRIGFSNHHPGIQFILASVVMGAEMVEFHFTLDRGMYGSDQGASIEIPGVQKIVKHIQAIEEGMGTGKWIVTPQEEEIKKKLRRCL